MTQTLLKMVSAPAARRPHPTAVTAEHAHGRVGGQSGLCTETRTRGDRHFSDCRSLALEGFALSHARCGQNPARSCAVTSLVCRMQTDRPLLTRRCVLLGSCVVETGRHKPHLKVRQFYRGAEMLATQMRHLPAGQQSEGCILPCDRRHAPVQRSRHL